MRSTIFLYPSSLPLDLFSDHHSSSRLFPGGSVDLYLFHFDTYSDLFHFFNDYPLSEDPELAVVHVHAFHIDPGASLALG